ncbi:protein RD3-like [Phyllopteryx taeniolatus]|uniref:protein RD3-like n=1 Tax=Phyllopteryx taeniolatus TaxID=161469 RepID=UPI002AD4834E|nr:protein RD3-like [Phyllopteryx taeniolatus]
MPLFSWPKWSHYTSTQAEASSRRNPEDRPSHDLIRELLWYVQDRECTARMLELEHKLAHSTVDNLCFQRCPRWRTFIPTSELDQLELLCAGIPPIHTAAVLSRFREVLADSKVMPWELVSVFKLVLRDINQRKYGEEHNLSKKMKQLPTTAFWTSSNKLEQHVVKACSSDEKLREEIPTVSGYVDSAMRCTSLLTAKREWEIPSYYPVPMRPTEACNIPRGHSPE